jgi:hypothetical protein
VRHLAHLNQHVRGEPILGLPPVLRRSAHGPHDEVISRAGVMRARTGQHMMWAASDC